MGRRSSIEQLPQELADLCHRMIREGRTIQQITDKLNELDADVSMSAVGRYTKSAREQMKRYRDAQQVAGMWVEQIGENSKGDVATLCGQMLTGIAHATLDQIAQQQMTDEEPGGKPAKPMKPMDLMLLAKALESMESTSKRSMERRERIERQVLERQANAAEKVAAKQGMSAEHWAQLRAQFLGIPVEAEAAP